MKQIKISQQWLAAVSVIGILGAADLAVASINSDTRKAAVRTGASAVTEINFSKESTELSDSAKSELQALIADANKKGPIKSVQVVAWADQEYPPEGVGLAQSQIELAEKRAEGIQSYLQKSLNVADVSTVNMAERPSEIQNILKTPEAKTKDALETSGAAPTSSVQTGFFGLKGKASKAVVMIYYK